MKTFATFVSELHTRPFSTQSDPSGQRRGEFQTDVDYGRTDVAFRINARLRQGGGLTPEDARLVDHLESLMGKNIIAAEGTVFRGGPLLPTGLYRGFLSTSTRESLAAPFGSLHVITVVAGTHFAFGDVTEHEIILPRDGRLTRVGPRADGTPRYTYQEHPDVYRRLVRREQQRQQHYQQDMDAYL